MIKDAHRDPREDPRPAGVRVVDEAVASSDGQQIALDGWQTTLEEQLLAFDEELAVQARRGLPPEEWPETRAAAVVSSRPGPGVRVGDDSVLAVATERVIAVPPQVSVDPSAVDVSDPVARDLARSAPGAALLDHLERLAVLDGPGSSCELSDAVLVEVAAACDRVIGRTMALQARAMASFDARREAEAAMYAHEHPEQAARGGASSSAVEELSARRRCTRHVGARDVHHARNLALAEPVREALAAGQVDVVRATVIAEAAAGVRPEHAERLADRVLPGAGRISVGAVRSRCRRAIGSLDPESAREAARQVAQSRSCFTTRVPDTGDGTSCGGRVIFEMDGPAAGVLALGGAVEARALALRAAERAAAAQEGRVARDQPLGAWRYDACVDIAHAVLEGALGSIQRSAASRPVIHLTVPAATLMGLSEEPGELVGGGTVFGPVPADHAREIAADGIWRRVLTDPSGRMLEVGERTYKPSAHLAALVRADHAQCTAPWCGRPARDCDLDQLTPWPRGATSRSNLHPVCPRDHRLKHSELGVAAHRDPAGAIVHTTRTGHRYTSHDPGEDPPWGIATGSSPAGDRADSVTVSASRSPGGGHGDPPF